MSDSTLITKPLVEQANKKSEGQTEWSIKVNLRGGGSRYYRVPLDPDEVLSWEPPEAGTRIASKRDDDRSSNTVYLNDEELTNLKAILPEDAIKDPKVARAARKAKKAAEAGGTGEVETPDGKSPFEDFGTD